MKLQIAVTTELGSHIYTEIEVGEDYSMNEVVKTVNELGYKSFRLIDTMKVYVRV